MSQNLTLSNLVIYASDLERSKEFYGRTLGLNLCNQTSSSAFYMAGRIDLEVRSAASDGVELTGGRDDTSLIVFHVNDLDRMRSMLESKGIQFDETLRYEIGATAAFYDPDGHNLTLYEPSAEAMTWRSADKIRELLPANSGRDVLSERPVIYLFLFVKSASQAFDFYHAKLGLKVLEDDPEAGVVKYDAQNVIVATHVVGGDSRCAVDMDLTRAKGVAAAFSVDDTTLAFQRLSSAGIPFREVAGQGPHPAAYFKDSNGHPLFIRSLAPHLVAQAALTSTMQHLPRAQNEQSKRRKPAFEARTLAGGTEPRSHN